jgi:hypothetical protein
MTAEASGAGETRPYRIFCALMAAVFVLSAAVQWNDPDPARWIGFYAFAALTALTAILQARWLRVLETSLAGLALAVVVAFAPALGGVRVEAVTSIEMKSAGDEEVRELGGAAIVLAFAAVLVVRRARSRDAHSDA